MAKKLIALETAARTARKAMTNPQGISGDLDIVAERISKGKKAKVTLRDGSQVWATVNWIMNAGFRGIEVTVTLKDGARRTVEMKNVKIWQNV